jgi:O-antigen/teichoic acid export membrane protein
VAAKLLLDGRNLFAVIAVGFGLLSISFVDLVQHYYRGRGWFGRDAALQIGARVALLAFGLVGLALGDLQGLATGILVAGVTSALGAGAALVADCGRPRFAPQRWRSIRATIVEALPVGLGALVSVLAFRVDVYLLAALRGEASVGLYSSAYRVFEATQAFPAVLMTVVFPRLAAVRGEAGATSSIRRQSLVALALVGLLVTIAGTSSARFIVEKLFGHSYSDAAAPLAVLCLAAPIMYVNAFLTQELIARGRAGAFARGATLALAVNVAANLLVIPRFGTVGAAAATIASEIALLCVCLAASRSRS